jgi:hypothetical protein
MPAVSVNWLSRHTGKDWRTVKKRIDKLPQDKHGRVDSATALEAIYCGTLTTSNGFISTPEAIRQLTIAKKEEIELQMSIVRGQRIPIDDVNAVVRMAFQSVRGIIKASKLPIESCNEIFDALRQASQELRTIGDSALARSNDAEPEQEVTAPA